MDTEPRTQAPLLDETQAADLMSVSPRTLQAWRTARRGPPFVRIGARIRYCPRTLSSWIGAQHAGAATPRKPQPITLAHRPPLPPRMVELIAAELAQGSAGAVHFGASAQRRLSRAIGPHEAALARALCRNVTVRPDGTILLVVPRGAGFSDAHLSPDVDRIAVTYDPATGQWVSDVAAGAGGFDQLCGHVWRIQGRPRGGMAVRDLLAHVGAAYLALICEGRAA